MTVPAKLSEDQIQALMIYIDIKIAYEMSPIFANERALDNAERQLKIALKAEK